MSDEVRANPRYKTPKKKKKKSFAESFIPMRGDSAGEVVSKLIALVSIAALAVCAVVLGLYFYHIFEAKQNLQQPDSGGFFKLRPCSRGNGRKRRNSQRSAGKSALCRRNACH